MTFENMERKNESRRWEKEVGRFLDIVMVEEC